MAGRDSAAETRHELEELRAAKDDFFRRSPDSPLTHDQRHGFAGLRYYDPDDALRFVVPLDESDGGRVEEVETSTGSTQHMIRAGHLSFAVDGRPASLVAYRSDGDGSLFVPFRDATSRAETYPAGRYVEVEPLPDGRFVLDFNRAYNPYCAYNDAWRCPLPPSENQLAVEIRAGEKRFHD